MRNNLITLIHQHTMKEHQITESLPFIQRYKDRQITLKQHYAHLEQLAAIYSILENHTLRLHIKLPKELRRRLTPLNKDIKELRKDMSIHTETEANLCPGTVDYCNHLSQLSSSNLLLAHCLVRYLGDLFGGKKVRAYIQETLPNAPVNFYRFASSKNTVYNIKRQSFESSRKIMDAIKQRSPEILANLDRSEAFRYITPVQRFNKNSIVCVFYFLCASALTYTTSRLLSSFAWCALLSYLCTESYPERENFLQECTTAFTFHKRIFTELESRFSSPTQKSNKDTTVNPKKLPVSSENLTKRSLKHSPTTPNSTCPLGF